MQIIDFKCSYPNSRWKKVYVAWCSFHEDDEWRLDLDGEMEQYLHYQIDGFWLARIFFVYHGL